MYVLSNAGLFEHMTKYLRHMDVFCARTQIFLIIICLPMLDFCAYDQEHRHMDVFCVRTQIFLIIICLPMLDYLYKQIGAWVYSVSIKNLRICAYNPALGDFVIQNHYKQSLRTYAKKLPRLY